MNNPRKVLVAMEDDMVTAFDIATQLHNRMEITVRHGRFSSVT